eukprot:14114997-Ditylum_brightwellii.AAC.1
MYLYVTIVHHKEWKDIKFSEMVLNHLKKNHVFAYVDEYKAKKVGSPGCISKIHPKLVNIPNLKVAVMSRVKMAKCAEKEVDKWKENHNHMDESTNALPFFTMFVQTKRWGQPPKRTKATMIVIQCAAEDTAYLKMLMSAAYEQELIKEGVFLPQGI